MRKNVNKFTTILIILALVPVLCACKKAPTVYYDAAWAYLENNQPEDAVYNFELSIAEEKRTKEALRGLGIALINTGEYERATEVFIEALHMSTGHIQEIDYDINGYLGYAYEQSGNFDAAIETYTALLTLHPKDYDTYYQRALCYLEKNEMTAADEDFAVVTSKRADDYDLHIKIFFSMKNTGHEVEGKSYLQAILEDGKRKISDYDRGRMCYYLEDYSNARVYLEKAKDFSNPDTILLLGKTYEAINDNNYAASLYAQYLDSKGNNAAVYNQLGICRWKLEDYEGALAAFTFGLKLDDPEWNRELKFNEAVTYEYMHDYDMAYAIFSEYLTTYPKDEKAIHEYTFLSTRVSDSALSENE